MLWVVPVLLRAYRYYSEYTGSKTKPVLPRAYRYSACPNNRGGIVELSGAGNPKNLTTFKGGAKRFTFLRSKKNVFLMQVL